MAPRYKCDYCDSLALFAGSLIDSPTPWPNDGVKVCQEHLDETKQKISIALYGGR